MASNTPHNTIQKFVGQYNDFHSAFKVTFLKSDCN